MRFLLFVVLVGICASAQNPYPQDYFRSPMDIPIVLAGTFGELRSNHFHAGLDIKTQRKQGLSVYATADGYVSRIKISHYGYGKALYITHPNGYTTVYAHLKSFSPEIEAYVKECQYEKESYQVEMFPTVNELKVIKGNIVAYSGNTGSSGGPHLHYEIRDNQERPINPMLFGIDVPDTKAPRIKALYGYANTKDSHINGSTGKVELRLIPTQDGDYTTEKISAYGNIGFGVISYDQLDMANNKNGLWNIQSFFNGNNSLEIDFRRFSFAETKHLNRLIDYAHYKENKERIQKLFIEKNNPLSMYKEPDNNGYLAIKDSTSSVYKIRLRDFKDNETWINIPIEGKIEKSQAILSDLGNVEIIADEPTAFEEQKYKVFIPANSFYDDVNLNFKVSSDTLRTGEDRFPLQKSFTVTYDISDYASNDKDKLYIAKLYGYYQNPSYLNTERSGNFLKARTKSFGTFTIETDTINPVIKPVNFEDKKWISSFPQLKIKIEDTESGISDYRATVNGKWILMEYEYKKKMLVHNFSDNVLTDTENKLKVIVTDNVGNSSTFEATFFRK